MQIRPGRTSCGLLLIFALALPIIRAQDKPKLNLTGDRFRGLTYEELTPAQKVIADRALAGPGAIGIFNITLRSPELSDAMRGISASRTQPLLSTRQNELAILLTGRFWTTQYEWMVHHRAAGRAGLSEETISAIAEGRRPAALEPDETAIYNFLSELLNLRQVSDATFQAAKEKIGEKGIVDLIGLTGFYQTVSLMMNVDRFPLPADRKPELELLAKPLPLASGVSAGSNASANPKTAGPLRGDRFRPLAAGEMTPAQKALFDLIQSGKLEGGVNGPLNVLSVSHRCPAVWSPKELSAAAAAIFQFAGQYNQKPFPQSPGNHRQIGAGTPRTDH
jgi:4-carboxymuconolactone decarboxylase